MATTEAEQQSGEPMAGLSAFQRDLLVAIRDSPGSSGQSLARALEAHYDEITNARLYQNLAELVEEGLLTKHAVDKRSDAYRLTEAGATALAADHAWRREESA